MSYPVVTGWQPKPTAVATTLSSGRRNCTDVTWLSTTRRGSNQDGGPVRRPLAPVDGEIGVAHAPHRPRGVELLARKPADGDDLVLDDVGEPPDAGVALGVPAGLRTPHPTRRRRVRDACDSS